MNRNITTGFFIGLILIFSVVYAAVYMEPWSNNQLGNQHNLTDMDYIEANTINATFTGNVNSSQVINPASACATYSAITGYGDNMSYATCTDAWVHRDGDTMTSTLSISNDTNISLLDLDKTGLGTGNVIDINNDGTGSGLFVKQDGAGYGAYIDQNGNNYGIYVVTTATTLTKYGLYVLASGGAKAGLFYQSKNVSALRINKAGTGSGEAVEIDNDGTSPGLIANQDGNGNGVYIDSEATSKAGLEVAMLNAAYEAIKLTTGLLNLNNNIITNIGNAGTDFTDTGGLTLADNLTINGAVYIEPGKKICWNADCTAYEYWNGTVKIEVYP